MTTIIMVHGVGGTADAFSRLAPAFRSQGWRVETPTLRPDLRVAENPPPDIAKLRLKDYVDDIEALARRLEAETGVAPVLFGHSMGGLVVQKLAERGVGRAAVLITPAGPADARGNEGALAQAFTFANVLMAKSPETRGHKIWRTGFSWGVLNRVPRAKHTGIFAGTVYDSGRVYTDIAYPERDPDRTAFIDERKITIPVLVIGGGKDRATPIASVRKVAEKYGRIGGDYLEYADNAHWIVDEPGTDKVIGDIAGWLSGKGLSPTEATPRAKGPAKGARTTKSAAPAKAARAKETAKAKPAKPKAAKPVAKAATKAPAKASAGKAAKSSAPAKPKATARKPKPS